MISKTLSYRENAATAFQNSFLINQLRGAHEILAS